MSAKETIEELQNKIITNYEDQIDLLKSINETNNRIIAAQKEHITVLEKRIEDITISLHEFQIILLKQL